MRINSNCMKRIVTLVAFCLFSIQFALAQTPNVRRITAKVDAYMNVAARAQIF